MHDFDKPSTDLMKTVSQEIDKSGFPLEWEVLQVFQRHSMIDELISPHSYYVDPSTGKLRETDLIAELAKVYAYDERFFVFAKTLVVECKQSTEHPWLFFTEPVTKHGPKSLFNMNEIGYLRDPSLAAKITDVTHYLKVEGYCYSYCSVGSGKDILQESLFQACNASYAYKGRLKQSLSAIHNEPMLMEANFAGYLDLYCPIVVFKGYMFQYEFHSVNPIPKPTRHVLVSFPIFLERTPKETGPSRFLVDVVRFDYLGDFLKQLQEETDAQISLLDAEHQTILQKLFSDG